VPFGCDLAEQDPPTMQNDPEAQVALEEARHLAVRRLLAGAGSGNALLMSIGAGRGWSAINRLRIPHFSIIKPETCLRTVSRENWRLAACGACRFRMPAATVVGQKPPAHRLLHRSMTAYKAPS
jgi:hypothetical protein